MWHCQLEVFNMSLDRLDISHCAKDYYSQKCNTVRYNHVLMDRLPIQIQSCIRLPFFFKHPQLIKEQMHAQTWIDCSWLCHMVFSCLDPSTDYLLFSLLLSWWWSLLVSDRWYSLAFDLWECSSYVRVWADSSLMPVLRPACGGETEIEDCCFTADQFPTKAAIYSGRLISCHRNLCTLFLSKLI